MFSSKPNQRQKALFKGNIDGIIDANNQIDQLMALLINNFGEQFDEMSPRIVEQLEAAKQHMANLNVIFRAMHK